MLYDAPEGTLLLISSSGFFPWASMEFLQACETRTTYFLAFVFVDGLPVDIPRTTPEGGGV